jgi:hypothetical protein
MKKNKENVSSICHETSQDSDKKNNKINEITNESNTKQQIVYVQETSSRYLNNFLLVLLTILLAVLVAQQQQQNGKLTLFGHEKFEQNLNVNSELQDSSNNKAKSNDQSGHGNVNMDALFVEMGEKLKKEIIEYFEGKKNENKNLLTTTTTARDESEIILELKNDKITEINIKTSTSTPSTVTTAKATLDSQHSKLNKKEEIRKLNKKKISEANSSKQDLNDNVKKFSSLIISKMKPKKMWIPIPNRFYFN